jgi:hypothetical protein
VDEMMDDAVYMFLEVLYFCYYLWAIRTPGIKWEKGLKMKVTKDLGVLGDIGLLLNAPYKIDSMVWMRLC